MIRGFKIKGQYFEEETLVNLFFDEDPNVKEKKIYSLLYGKNGSGKTVISDAISSYRTSDLSFDLVIPFDVELNEIEIDKNNIFVFNEDFTNKNITLSTNGDGINAIVLFGQAGDLESQIVLKKQTIQNNKIQADELHMEFFDEKGNEKSILDSFNAINSLLKMHWASREQMIHSNKNKAAVKEYFVKDLISKGKPKGKVDDLMSTFNNLLKIINATKNIESKFPPVYIDLNFKKDSFYNELVGTSFNKKTSTDFAKEILQLIEAHSSKFLTNTKDLFSNGGRCPLCFQEVTIDYCKETSVVIDDLFDTKIENEKNRIQNSKIMKISDIDFSIYNDIIVISSTYSKKINDAIKQINFEIDKINDTLDTKIGSIYTAISETNFELDKAKDKLNSLLLEANKVILDFNEQVDKRINNIKLAEELNKEIALFEIWPQSEIYNKLLREKADKQKKFDELYSSNKRLEIEIVDLNSKKANSFIALNEINSYLAYIFGSTKRLYLKPNGDGNSYYVYSKGKKIKLKKLSTGERNAISLVYFYETMKEKNSINEYFRNELLVIIDDPISSFDYENKIGILSFLKVVISEIISGNQNSQISIFTHSLEIASYIFKIFSDLSKGGLMCVREICDKTTKRINVTKFTNYGKLLLDVYHYGNGDLPSEDYPIGNTIRRLIEAYSQFNYKETMDKFLSKKEYFSKISDLKLAEYFKNRMARILMNEESHSGDVIRQVPDTLNFDLFSDKEIEDVAKDVIVFIYLLDSEHISRYLNGENGAVENIEKWVLERKSLLS